MIGTAFAVELRLHPGQALPTVQGTRPELAPRLTRGRRAAELPALLGGLFSLCAHAHRVTAQRAVAAARGQAPDTSSAERLALQLATAREQLLRIAHDWPRQLGGEAGTAAVSDLRGCPLWRETLPPAQRIDALRGWLQAHWLAGPIERWLARQADDARWALAWCEAERQHSPLAALLHAHRRDAIEAQAQARPLQLLAAPAETMPLLAQHIATRPGFCSRPDWQGEAAETGPWTRALEQHARLPDNAWMRLIARLVDLLQLVQPGGAARLAQGSLPLGRHAAIAWTEMARGLLVHQVQLDDTGERIADCRVLAPTEWNLHPRGVLARALVPLRGPRAAAQARCLAAAFDPCLPFSVVTPLTVEEPACTS